MNESISYVKFCFDRKTKIVQNLIVKKIIKKNNLKFYLFLNKIGFS